MRYLFPTICLAFSNVALAATNEPVTVLGIPIGGALKAMPKTCPFDTDKSKNPCWVGTPHKHADGSYTGGLHLPDPDSRPKWAAYATFDAQISRERVLDKLSARAHGTRNLKEIQDSISSRFGLPTSSSSSPSAISSTWSKPEIHIKLLCSPGDFCVVELTSPAYRADYERQMEQRRAKDATRPSTI